MRPASHVIIPTAEMHHALHVILANTGACHQGHEKTCMGMSHSVHSVGHILEEFLQGLQKLDIFESLGNRSFSTSRLQSWAGGDCGRGTVRCVKGV